ncbi:hypothetical protein CDL15_Pgr011954 [Punica granatum]|uniref:Uncharacterized protein n=1 Tax=Punica granatum TaxID=22663 RepID=A0A218WDE8_PUNGR|nr:hypothetical protein CDL15_Pgr011954 [Punica granatum]
MRGWVVSRWGHQGHTPGQLPVDQVQVQGCQHIRWGDHQRRGRGSGGCAVQAPESPGSSCGGNASSHWGGKTLRFPRSQTYTEYTQAARGWAVNETEINSSCQKDLPHSMVTREGEFTA